MTPKEKAKELLQKSCDLDKHKKNPQSKCKEIALLCVNEIIKATQRETINASGTGINIIPRKYWLDVQQEINKL